MLEISGRKLRVAVCQEWILGRYGSEQVAARIAHALAADGIYAFAAAEDATSELFPDVPVRSSGIGRRRIALERLHYLLPIMGTWWRFLGLRDYDIVFTSSHAAVNSVRVRPGAVHLSYCSTPMRYAWLWRTEIERVPKILRPAWPLVAASLRWSDRRRSRHVDLFIANSSEVAGRIEAFYGRTSPVVPPPVDTAFFAPDGGAGREDFFLYAGRLVAYKQPAAAVAAAQEAGVRLIVAGAGPEEERLRRMGGPLIEFRHHPSDEELRDLYRRARALVFSGVEDFGMVMVEAQACGTPVIALASGGALDAVVDGVTGVLYGPDAGELVSALRSFDPTRFDPAAIRKHAENFGFARFEAEIRSHVETVVRSRSKTGRRGA